MVTYKWKRGSNIFVTVYSNANKRLSINLSARCCQKNSSLKSTQAGKQNLYCGRMIKLLEMLLSDGHLGMRGCNQPPTQCWLEQRSFVWNKIKIMLSDWKTILPPNIWQSFCHCVYFKGFQKITFPIKMQFILLQRSFIFYENSTYPFI